MQIGIHESFTGSDQTFTESDKNYSIHLLICGFGAEKMDIYWNSLIK